VKEESQIDDMRAAVRGDRERAEQARQRSSESVLALTAPVAAARPAEEPASLAEPRRRGMRGFFKRR
jgi:hypothetical protein